MGLVKKKLFGEKKARWPYLWQLVENGTFLRIDYAYAEKILEDGPECKAALLCTLMAFSRMGHLCLKVGKQIEPDLKQLTNDSRLEELIFQGAQDQKLFHLPRNEQIEKKIVEQVHRLVKLPKKETKTVEHDSSLTNEQASAVQNALRYPLSLITGGPGTGKTFVATQIVKAFLDQDSTSIILTAPTGKAAAHLESKLASSMASIRSGTMHNFLKVRSILDYKSDAIELDADLVVVDECSMIDPQLFGRLLSSIGRETHLVLMGDSNQLPAVEGGSVFRDLIESSIPSSTLTKCHRIDRKEILDLAQGILAGQEMKVKNIDLGFEQSDLQLIYENLWNHAKEHFPVGEKWLTELNRFRILSTLRKGPLGVDVLNHFLQERFSAKTDHFPIMIRRNDPVTGLCNGDTGVLIKNERAVFEGGKSFLIHELPSFEYAYCLSVHKSQGSEFDHVLLIVPEGSESFGKEVLYTAVTRAKSKLEIDGSAEQIASAMKRESRKVSSIQEML